MKKLVRKNYFLNNLKDSNKSTYGKRKGAAGELYAKFRASMDGYIVSSEESDCFDFDFTVFNKGEHYGVQAKSGIYSKRQGANQFTTVKRVRRHKNGVPYDVMMPYQYVDLFAFIDLRHLLIAWMPFSEIKTSKKTIPWNEFEYWTLDKIIGEPDIDLHVEDYIDDIDDDIVIYNQQDLFKYKEERNNG
jgi:hypothetical protein